MPNSINKILNDIKTNDDSLLVNYKWSNNLQEYSTSRPFKTKNLRELLIFSESLGHLLFISTNVINCEALSKYFYEGNIFQLSNAVQLTMIISALNNEDKDVYLSDWHLLSQIFGFEIWF